MEFVLKNPCRQLCSFSLAPCQRAMHVPLTRVWKLWQVLGTQFFGTIVLMKFVPKIPCQQLRIFRAVPANEAMHVPSPSGCTPLDKSWAHSFSAQSHWWNLSWKNRASSSAPLALLPANKAMQVPSPRVCTPLDKSWAHSFSAQSHWLNLSWKTRANSSALLALLPANKAMHLHTAWQVLGAQFFGTIALMEFVLKTRANNSTFSLYRSF